MKGEQARMGIMPGSLKSLHSLKSRFNPKKASLAYSYNSHFKLDQKLFFLKLETGSKMNKTFD